MPAAIQFYDYVFFTWYKTVWQTFKTCQPNLLHYQSIWKTIKNDYYYENILQQQQQILNDELLGNVFYWMDHCPT